MDGRAGDGPWLDVGQMWGGGRFFALPRCWRIKRVCRSSRSFVINVDDDANQADGYKALIRSVSGWLWGCTCLIFRLFYF